MFDTLKRPQAVRQVFYFPGPALDRDYLQTIVVVQVNMLGGNNQALPVMLDICNFF